MTRLSTNRRHRSETQHPQPLLPPRPLGERSPEGRVRGECHCPQIQPTRRDSPKDSNDLNPPAPHDAQNHALAIPKYVIVPNAKDLHACNRFQIVLAPPVFQRRDRHGSDHRPRRSIDVRCYRSRRHRDRWRAGDEISHRPVAVPKHPQRIRSGTVASRLKSRALVLMCLHVDLECFGSVIQERPVGIDVGNSVWSGIL